MRKGALERIAAAIALMLSSLTACTANTPNETAILNQIGFNAPVQARVPLLLIQHPGVVNSDPDARALDSLLRADIVTFSPNTSRAPWYSVSVTGGQSDSMNLTFPVGHRSLTGSKEQRSWQTGSIQYYAETVDYTIVVDPRFHLENSILGSYSVRIVLSNDPAIGHWQLDSQSDLRALSTDFQDVQNAILATGDPNHLRSTIAGVAHAAQDQIRNEMMAALGEQRESDGVVRLVSQNRRYYVPPQELRDGATFSEARRACTTLSLERRRWHLASYPEASALFSSRGDRSYFDTAEFSIWGPAVNAGIVLLTDGWNDNNQATSGIAEGETVGMRAHYVIRFQPDGSGRFDLAWPNDYNLTVGNILVAWTSNDGLTRTKVLCAAST